ncbi:MAG: NAD(+)/NADH kinase [Bdellovibrionota bacterium]
MKNLNEDEVDVIIIQKQTALERYTKRHLNIDFLDYLSQDIQSKEQLNSAHHAHVESRKILLECLRHLKMKSILLNLDELKESKLHFFQENKINSGFAPKQNIVISLGGDGTLLHASHYVGGKIQLLGVNSCPENSVGHLCAANSKNVHEILEQILVEKNSRAKSLKRLRIKVSNHKNIPLALNDILISHLHPAATSRYQISILNKEAQVTQCEKQLSSGLWIATAAGSTAAISAYGFPAEPLESHKILAACREPYAAKGEPIQLNKLTLDGSKQSLAIFSRMRQGLVCLDGPDFSIQFGFGETIEVSSPDEASLLLVQ